MSFKKSQLFYALLVVLSVVPFFPFAAQAKEPCEFTFTVDSHWYADTNYWPISEQGQIAAGSKAEIIAFVDKWTNANTWGISPYTFNEGAAGKEWTTLYYINMAHGTLSGDCDDLGYMNPTEVEDTNIALRGDK